MIEKWLEDDIRKTFTRGYLRFVICDPKKEARYLCDHLPSEWLVKDAHTDLEELQVKYEAEKTNPESPVVFYTSIPPENLSFLMEYATIDGCLDLSELHQYIKQKVHEQIGLNLNLGKDELLTAARVSVGKEEKYWMGLSYRGSEEIFDLQNMLLPFLHDPEGYTRALDTKVRQAFLNKVQQQIGQQAIDKPAATVAKEAVAHLLHGLLENDVDQTLLNVYYQWIDSATNQHSLNGYIKAFSIPSQTDLWSVHVNHPFREIDVAQMRELTSRLNDAQYLSERMPFIKARANSKYAHLLAINWWPNMLELIQFDSSGIKTISSFEEAIKYYRETFYKLDRAIRKLYAEFLSKSKIMQPLQERYEGILNDLLNKWFEYFDEIKENQTGCISKIIEASPDKVAVIVGDGISYEVALEVVQQSTNELQVEKNYMIADLPSVTDNNMSRLYLKDGRFSKSKSKREQQLDNTFQEKEIKHVYLEDLNQSHSENDVLICSYKDIDDIAEKMQQKALKYLDKIVTTLSDKIEELSNLGFHSVYLISDHGFVLSGLLSESDKIEFTPDGQHIKSERFIACNRTQYTHERFVQLEKEYSGFNYLLFSKNLRPFKSTGSYGYAHGGASPQELIVPHFHFKISKKIPQLLVSIQDKSGLKEIEGDNFRISVKAEESEGNLFKSERKCQLNIFSGQQEINKGSSFTLYAGDKKSQEFSFDSKKELTIYLVDANSKEQLDKVTIKQATGRDLGGLL